jgi:hypothetical protein
MAVDKVGISLREIAEPSSTSLWEVRPGKAWPSSVPSLILRSEMATVLIDRLFGPAYLDPEG